MRLSVRPITAIISRLPPQQDESGAQGVRTPSVKWHFGGQRPPMAANSRVAGDELISMTLALSANRRHGPPLSYHDSGRKLPLKIRPKIWADDRASHHEKCPTVSGELALHFSNSVWKHPRPIRQCSAFAWCDSYFTLACQFFPAIQFLWNSSRILVAVRMGSRKRVSRSGQRKLDRLNTRRNGISKADVDLHWDTGICSFYVQNWLLTGSRVSPTSCPLQKHPQTIKPPRSSGFFRYFCGASGRFFATWRRWCRM